MPVCEGCGTRTDDAHVARRAERIELAARFRPIQIKVLFLDAAPPSRIEDFFYSVPKDKAARSVAAKTYSKELGKALGPTLMASSDDGILAENHGMNRFPRFFDEFCCVFRRSDDGFVEIGGSVGGHHASL